MKKFCIALCFCLAGVLIQKSTFAEDVAGSMPPRYPNLYWGAPTNGILGGVSVKAVSNISKIENLMISLMLYNMSTNNGNIRPNVMLLVAPPLKDRCKLEFTDKNGKAVQRTARGEALGEKTPEPYKVRPRADGVTIDTGIRPGEVILPSREAQEILPPFRLTDYFKIKSPGRYHLRCEIRIFELQRGDINKLKLITLPPVNANIEIKP